MYFFVAFCILYSYLHLHLYSRVLSAPQLNGVDLETLLQRAEEAQAKYAPENDSNLRVQEEVRRELFPASAPAPALELIHDTSTRTFLTFRVERGDARSQTGQGTVEAYLDGTVEGLSLFISISSLSLLLSILVPLTCPSSSARLPLGFRSWTRATCW
jgi:hypothetical protein